MSKAVGKVFGGGGGPGAIGTGRQKIKEIDIAREPFVRKVAEDEGARASRARQEELTEALAKRARGEDSVAGQRIQRERERGQAARRAEAVGRRGRGGALAQRQQARQAAEEQARFAQEAGIAEAQERVAAQQTLAQQIAQQRAQDIAVAESDRAARQALEQLRVQQRIGSFAPSVAAFEGAAKRRGELVSGIGSGIATMAASDENLKKNKAKTPGKSKEFLERLKRGVKKQAETKASFGIKEEESGQKKTGKLIGGALAKAFKSGGAEKAAAASDKDLKVHIKSGRPHSKDFLDKLQSYSYDYKDKKHGEGRQFSVMAQDLEKAGDVGKQMVIDTPEGKMVDYGKGFGAILAAQVELNERLKDVEKKKKKKG